MQTLYGLILALMLIWLLYTIKYIWDNQSVIITREWDSIMSLTTGGITSQKAYTSCKIRRLSECQTSLQVHCLAQGLLSQLSNAQWWFLWKTVNLPWPQMHNENISTPWTLVDTTWYRHKSNRSPYCKTYNMPYRDCQSFFFLFFFFLFAIKLNNNCSCSIYQYLDTRILNVEKANY